MKHFLFSSLCFLLPLLPASAGASSAEHEQRMANEIIDMLLDGDAVYLTADEKKFLTIYTESGSPRGIAIILHGRGFHPDWPDTVHPLRVGLPETGWSTLSVQMPVLEKQAKYYDYLAVFPHAGRRINAAIKYARTLLADIPNGKLVLIAHSCGAHMAMAWVDATDNASASIDAYIGLGMGATDYQQPMLKPFPLSSLHIPVLDIYAESDYPAVLKMSSDRLTMIEKAGHSKSRQLMMKDSGHYYQDRGTELTTLISQWLSSL